MKIKTSQLSGPALDWAVCTAQGWELREVEEPKYWHNDPLVKKLRWFSSKHSTKGLFSDVKPTRDWSMTGSLVEKYHITLESSLDGTHWSAQCPDKECPCWHQQEGHGPLEAISRAIVASEFGDEVDVPDELGGVE